MIEFHVIDTFQSIEILSKNKKYKLEFEVSNYENLWILHRRIMYCVAVKNEIKLHPWRWHLSREIGILNFVVLCLL